MTEGQRYEPDWHVWDDGPVKRAVATVVDKNLDAVRCTRAVDDPDDAERVANELAAEWNRRYGQGGP